MKEEITSINELLWEKFAEDLSKEVRKLSVTGQFWWTQLEEDPEYERFINDEEVSKWL